MMLVGVDKSREYGLQVSHTIVKSKCPLNHSLKKIIFIHVPGGER